MRVCVTHMKVENIKDRYCMYCTSTYFLMFIHYFQYLRYMLYHDDIFLKLKNIIYYISILFKVTF